MDHGSSASPSDPSFAAYLTLSGTLYTAADSIRNVTEPSNPISQVIFPLLILTALVIIYFIPTAIAHDTTRIAAIAVANFAFGWIVIGWFAVLVWALAEAASKPKTPPPLP